MNPSVFAQSSGSSSCVRLRRRMRYEDCSPGCRIVHETKGPGTIVRTSAQLVVVRPDHEDLDILAFAEQLRADPVTEEQLRADPVSQELPRESRLLQPA